MRTPASTARHTSRAPKRLARYNAKRNFSSTSEPPGELATANDVLSFVIQKHDASHLHYDFRLEIDGVLVSWAVPKGPSCDPADKRLAVHVEDHPLSYGTFEGTIPPKQYGAGTVLVWDNGTWEPEGDPRRGLKRGKLAFTLHGHKLHGKWELVKIARGGEKQEPWLLFKKRDAFARTRAEYDVVVAQPDSVLANPHPAPEAKKPGKGVRSELPLQLAPQLATLANSAPVDGEWLYEIKFDGYRIMARIDKGKVRLLSRSGQLPVASAWLDGEVVRIRRVDS